MITEQIKKELIWLSKRNKYRYKIKENEYRNLMYKSKCGDQILFKIKKNNDKFYLKYDASGCIVSLASAYTLSKLCDNNSQDKILDIIKIIISYDYRNLEDIDISLKAFNIFINTNRKDCFLLPYKALKESLREYKTI